MGREANRAKGDVKVNTRETKAHRRGTARLGLPVSAPAPVAEMHSLAPCQWRLKELPSWWAALHYRMAFIGFTILPLPLLLLLLLLTLLLLLLLLLLLQLRLLLALLLLLLPSLLTTTTTTAAIATTITTTN
jgi:hypothetical protein